MCGWLWKMLSPLDLRRRIRGKDMIRKVQEDKEKESRHCMRRREERRGFKRKQSMPSMMMRRWYRQFSGARKAI